jgi:hypothetical protein
MGGEIVTRSAVEKDDTVATIGQGGMGEVILALDEQDLAHAVLVTTARIGRRNDERSLTY